MRYQRFLDISQSPDLSTFQKRLIEFAEELGFGLISASVITEQPDRTRAFKTIHNAPSAFAEEVTLNGEDARRDPVLQMLKRTRIPFIYDQSLYVDSGAGDLWEQQARFGYKTGVAVSLHMPGGTHFTLGFDRSEPLPSRDEDLTRLLGHLQLGAVHAQDVASRLLQPVVNVADTPRLTARELEILKWTAAGKTAGEVAQLLGISSHTVTFHTRNIMAKLSASNKHKAVLNAMALGLIDR